MRKNGNVFTALPLQAGVAIPRPTFLVAEPMPLEGISARKLVLEAARYNVITGYNADDAAELLRRFPGVDGMIVHAGIGNNNQSYRELIDTAIRDNPKCFIVVLSPDRSAHHPAAKFSLSSHDPKELLELLAERFKVPEAAQGH